MQAVQGVWVHVRARANDDDDGVVIVSVDDGALGLQGGPVRAWG